MFGAGASHSYRNRKPVLLLDLDGTLLPTEFIAEQIVVAAARAAGSGVPADRMAAAFREVQNRLFDANRYFLHSGSQSELARILRQTLGACAMRPTRACLADGVSRMKRLLADARMVRPFSGYLDVLRDLRRHGVALYVVTAGRKREQIAKVRALGLERLIPEGRVFVSEGSYRQGRAKDTPFHAGVICAIHRDPVRPARLLPRIRNPIGEARRRLATSPYTFYMVGDHPRIDVENFLRLVPEDTTALRAIRVRRGKWRTRVPASPEHMAVENLNHARLIVFSNHGIQAQVFPPGVRV